MTLLFVLLAVTVGIIFWVTPFWVAVGYLITLGWSAFLLYLIFYRTDPVSAAISHRLN